jgi:hypothetical protein
VTKTCPNCKAENDDDASFCQNCGEDLSQTSQSTQRVETSGSSGSTGWWSKRNKTVIGIAGVCIGLIIIIAIVGMFFPNNTNSNSNSTTVSSPITVGNITVSGPDDVGMYTVNAILIPNQNLSYLQMQLTWYDSSGTVIDQDPLVWNLDNPQSGQSYQANGQSDLYQKGTPVKVNVIIYDSVAASSSDVVYNNTLNVNS